MMNKKMYAPKVVRVNCGLDFGEAIIHMMDSNGEMRGVEVFTFKVDLDSQLNYHEQAYNQYASSRT